MSAPIASVVVVSDYGAGDADGWADLRRTIAGLRRQDFAEPFEVAVVESARYQSDVPDDLRRLPPGFTWVFADDDAAFGLKNAGVGRTRGRFVGMLDGDCEPVPGWVRSMVECLRAHPDAGAVSGRTLHPGDGLAERVFAMLSRAYLDQGDAVHATWTIANQNCGFRREVIEAYPYPSGWNAFGGEAHAELVKESGTRFYFHPGMLARHTFGGCVAERDVRRNRGHATARCRIEDPRIPHSWLTRLGPLSVPAFVAARFTHDLVTYARVGRHYGVTRRHAPVVVALSAWVHALEVGGLRAALRGERLAGPSNYR